MLQLKTPHAATKTEDPHALRPSTVKLKKKKKKQKMESESVTVGARKQNRNLVTGIMQATQEL